MLTQSQVEQTVEEQVRSMVQEAGDDLDEPLTAATELHELGINSLMLARLLIQLDETFAVENPFDNGEVLADVRSVGDVVGVYRRAIGHA